MDFDWFSFFLHPETIGDSSLLILTFILSLIQEAFTFVLQFSCFIICSTNYDSSPNHMAVGMESESGGTPGAMDETGASGDFSSHVMFYYDGASAGHMFGVDPALLKEYIKRQM